MENPNTGGVNLRRHNSLPAARRPSSHFVHHRNRLPAKSNPHVGWFRHSPPITSRCLSSERRERPSMTTSCRDYRCKSNHRGFELHYSETALFNDKSNPFVGFLRHAPSASRSSVCHRTMLSEYLETELSLLLRAIPTPDCNGLLRLTDLLCSGNLIGGSPRQEKLWSTGSSKNRSSTALGRPSLAAHVLRKVAGWILTPFLEEEEFLSQQQQRAAKTCCETSSFRSADDASSLYSRDSHDPSYDESSSSDDNSSCCSSLQAPPVEEEESSSSVRVVHQRKRRSSSASSSSSSSSSIMMVSSQAEAYYAHNAVSKPYQALQECNVYESTSSASDNENNSILGHRLDYNITQMDIVRMTRNASRHLDVESILKLPTVTYHSTKRRTINSTANTMYKIEEDQEHVDNSNITTTSTTTHHRQEEWSWLMVHQDGADAAQDETQQGNNDNNKNNSHHHHHRQDPERECVICLEPFVDGDRLRVLPCDHSFHVGCIDRWLSGSHSFDECYTAGCPTCKKHPCHDNDDDDYDDDDFLVSSTFSDGSVPSWAFSRIGNALARASSTSQHHSSTG